MLEELKLALQYGYRILSIFEILHFWKTEVYNPLTQTGGLYTKFINRFLKIKIEASGWPPGVETDQQKEEYICDFEKAEGIRLDPKNIKFNPIIRTISKLLLNILFGKMSQRSNMGLTEILDSREKLDKIIADKKYEINNIASIRDHILVNYTLREEYSNRTHKSAVLHASYVTSLARIILFKHMIQLDSSQLLYCDTDCIMYKRSDTLWPQKFIPIGVHLGDFKEEIILPQKIEELIIPGPKNYSMRFNIPNKDGESSRTVLKGFKIQNANIRAKINHQSIKNLVFNRKSNINITTYDDCFFFRDMSQSEIYLKKLKKNYTFTFNKRAVSDDFKTYPFGYLF